MNKTKSFFDLRLSQAIKKSQGDLKTPMNEEKMASSIPFEEIQARFLNGYRGSKSACRRRGNYTSAPEGNVLQKISDEFDAYTR